MREEIMSEYFRLKRERKDLRQKNWFLLGLDIVMALFCGFVGVVNLLKDRPILALIAFLACVLDIVSASAIALTLRKDTLEWNKLEALHELMVTSDDYRNS